MTVADDVAFTHAISLQFEEETTHRLLTARKALRANGIEPVDDRPHMTLAYVDRIEGVEQIAQQLTPIGSVAVASCGLVPNSADVIGLHPDSPQLRTLHRRLHDQLAAYGIASFDYCSPRQWFPHVTMAMHVPPEQRDCGREVLRRLSPTPLRVSGIGVYEMASGRSTTVAFFEPERVSGDRGSATAQRSDRA
ncbi:2'-5' RNA ligase family protein [Calidifontibacter sp. DB0510]|uniref:2'-5' RNA ligase family protein n=1 Tax=Metallococcus carri TaxID=1656884 RepID=A0A967B7T8_9MICO|nr:2'-5' RNA ligase family protein [Metallococcus carri]NHN57177.1 2'-5' RNA ligase family protein [Metallococcus carri]NOP38020.1 hypothetical protein [Calidifontibacter sp. DB2511S]